MNKCSPVIRHPSDAQPAQQALCKVRTEVVEVTRAMLDRSNANFLLWPPCVEVQRCSGCCNTKSLQCVPVVTHTRYLQVIDHTQKHTPSVETFTSIRSQADAAFVLLPSSSRPLQVMKIEYINKRPTYAKAVVSVVDHVECRCQPMPHPLVPRKKSSHKQHSHQHHNQTFSQGQRQEQVQQSVSGWVNALNVRNVEMYCVHHTPQISKTMTKQ